MHQQTGNDAEDRSLVNSIVQELIGAFSQLFSTTDWLQSGNAPKFDSLGVFMENYNLLALPPHPSRPVSCGIRYLTILIMICSTTAPQITSFFLSLLSASPFRHISWISTSRFWRHSRAGCIAPGTASGRHQRLTISWKCRAYPCSRSSAVRTSADLPQCCITLQGNYCERWTTCKGISDRHCPL